MKLSCAVLALVSVPAAFAANNAPIPTTNVAEFVFDKLDVTTLPSTLRPKPAKGKKTFGDYGYVTRQLDDQHLLVEAVPAGSQISFKILEQRSSAVYVCVHGQAIAKNAGGEQIQRVFLLKLKNSDGLLKGRESLKDFDGCPVTGEDPASNDSYGG